MSGTLGAGALVARVAALERQVAALGSRAAGGEALQPNYLTLTPDGQVGANFSGVINALGLTLPSAEGTSPSPDSSIQWTETAGGGLVASIQGYGSPSNGGLEITAETINLTGTTQAQMNAAGSQISLDQVGVGDTRELRIIQNTGNISEGSQLLLADGKITAYATTPGNAQSSALILDENANSSFLQLPSATNLKVQSGETGFSCAAQTWTGVVSTFPEVFTGPVAVVYSIAYPGSGGGANQQHYDELIVINENNFQVNLWNGVAASGDLYWVAFGAT